MTAAWLRQTAAGVELHLLVQPRASRDQLAGIQGAALKVRLAAPPVEGAANAACCALFAKLCRLPKSRVTLVGGETSRHKRLLLTGVDVPWVMNTLAPLVGGVDMPRASD